MSKILLSALLAVFSIFPAACSDISGELPDDMAGKSILTVYFSCTGTTKAIAERIASAAGSDIYAIIPEEHYSEEDLAYYTGGRADREQSDPSVRPSILGGIENMDKYDTIILYAIQSGTVKRQGS